MVSRKFDNDTISIIIRTLYFNQFNLERAIFSIYCSDYKSKEVVIVYQGQDDYQFKNFFLNISELYKSEINFQLIINNQTKTDQRAKNINIGIKSAFGRFLAFLDDDDFVDSRHYKNLIKIIKEKNYAWGYSGCMLNICKNGYILQKDYRFINQDYSLNRLLNENFIPIHSFIIDRSLINDKLIYTDEKLTRLEDYFILLNLCPRFFPAINKFIGVFYNLEHKKENESLNRLEWQNSRKIIDDLKQSILKDRKLGNLKKSKPLYKILFRIILLIFFLIPKLGEIIIKKKRVVKFVNDILCYLKNK
jgi:hypothetical protein